MSEQIKHECGIAFTRLLKPLEYYQEKYGTPFYGLNKMHILMEKQHNRGQDGAGLACVKLDPEPGSVYIDRIRSNQESPTKDIFTRVFDGIEEQAEPEWANDVEQLKRQVEFCGEVYLGHLRYATFGKNKIDNVHPVMRSSNWMTRNLVVAGNFNLTNIGELFGKMVSLGQYPQLVTDTVTIMERIGHSLDLENNEKYLRYEKEGHDKQEIVRLVAENMDIRSILSQASAKWDGGYVIAGIIGHGDSFVMRDPAGIRPGFYYADDEIIMAASERAVIQTALNVPYESVRELKPAHALIVRKNGFWEEVPVMEARKPAPCSFERIYFSRGTDRDIYRERKQMGRNLIPQIIKSIGGDIENTVFSYIPNTADGAFLGILQGMDEYCTQLKTELILKEKENLTAERLAEIQGLHVRAERVAVKDARMRTFITQNKARGDMASHVYDITYGSVREGVDNLVVVDDSIVRGNTLNQSIIRILDRLRPKKMIICSSAPQIRYPDCYGIDMSILGEFVAFRAAIELLTERGMEHVIEEVYHKAKHQLTLPKEQVVNCVKEIYAPFTDEEISERISQIVVDPDIHTEVEVVFQTVEGLHDAIPVHRGDWYFTGDYPTPGGFVVANRAFVNYYEKIDARAY